MSAVRAVASIEEEERHMRTCLCGGAWMVVSEALAPLDGHWYDTLVGRCSSCLRRERFVFDVTAFYQAVPRVWADYGSTGWQQ
jgi:hypothetical protein